MAKKDKPSKITPEMLGHINPLGGFDNMFDGQLDDPNKHLKELLTTDGDIDAKTDLKSKHISAIIKLGYLAELLGDGIKPDETFINIAEKFKRLRISKDRLSRKEFGDAIQGSNMMNRQEGMFNRMGSWFSGRN